LPPDAAAERERALAFLRTVDEARAERVVRVGERGSLGLAVFADSLPLVHDQNKALAARGLDVVDLDGLIDAVVDVQGAGGRAGIAIPPVRR
jgi:hypothetical protein